MLGDTGRGPRRRPGDASREGRGRRRCPGDAGRGGRRGLLLWRRRAAFPPPGPCPWRPARVPGEGRARTMRPFCGGARSRLPRVAPTLHVLAPPPWPSRRPPSVSRQPFDSFPPGRLRLPAPRRPAASRREPRPFVLAAACCEHHPRTDPSALPASPPHPCAPGPAGCRDGGCSSLSAPRSRPEPPCLASALPFQAPCPRSGSLARLSLLDAWSPQACFPALWDCTPRSRLGSFGKGTQALRIGTHPGWALIGTSTSCCSPPLVPFCPTQTRGPKFIPLAPARETERAGLLPRKEVGAGATAREGKRREGRKWPPAQRRWDPSGLLPIVSLLSS